MGGVDLQDQGINNYIIMMWGKKLWLTLFKNIVNISVVNARRLHRIVKCRTAGSFELYTKY